MTLSSNKQYKQRDKKQPSQLLQPLLLSLFLFLSVGILSAATVKTKWISLTSPTSSGVVSDGMNIYSVSESGIVYAFDAVSGERMWISDIGSKVYVTPTLYGGILYIGAEKGLYAVTTYGQLKGSVPLSNPVMTSPLVSEGNVIAITKNGTVNVIAAGDGSISRSKLLRTVLLPGETESSSAVYGGKIYTFLTDGRLFSIDPFTGTMVSLYDTGRSIWRSTPVFVGDMLYIGAGRFFMSVSSSGMMNMSKELGGMIYSPAYSDGVFYVGSDDGNLYAITGDGTVQWTYAAGDAIRTKPFITNTSVYITSHDKKLHSVDLNGRLHWSSNLPDWPSSPIVVGGTAYSVSYDGSITAVSTAGCSISVPEANSSVLARVSTAGMAFADSGLKTVEIRTVPGEWQIATGTTEWATMLPISGFPEGPVRIECRATDVDGNSDIQPYTSNVYQFIFSEEKLSKINSTAPNSANVKAPITIRFFSSNGTAITNLVVKVGNERYNVTDSNGLFVYVPQTEGTLTMFVEKPNYQTKTITINITKPLIQPIYVVIVLILIVGAIIYMSIRKGQWK